MIVSFLIICTSFVLPFVFWGLAFNYKISSLLLFYIIFLIWYISTGIIILKFGGSMKYQFLASNYGPFAIALGCLFYSNFTVEYLVWILAPYTVVVGSIFVISMTRSQAN